MIGSVLSEGARGLQNSQRDVARAANEIARANVRPEASAPGTERDVSTTLQPLEETQETEARQSISEPLVELRRQELVFDASAEVVSAGQRALGTILDTEA